MSLTNLKLQSSLLLFHSQFFILPLICFFLRLLLTVVFPIAGVVFVNRILPLRALQLYRNLHSGFFYVIVIAISLKAGSEHLNAHLSIRHAGKIGFALSVGF